MPRITHLLFDCDNTLVLSEVIAFRCCAQLSNEILEKHSISHRYTPHELQSEFVGFNFRGLLVALGQKHGFTLSARELDECVDAELALVTQKLSEEATECPNSTSVLEEIYKEKKYGLAVVSSSAISRVKASIRKTGQDKFFSPEHVYSAASSLPVPTTKPDPAIYIYACQQLSATPANCVAIEDSKTGATAAMRAGIPVIGYVGPYETQEERTRVGKTLRDKGAFDVMEDWRELQGILKRLETM